MFDEDMVGHGGDPADYPQAAPSRNVLTGCHTEDMPDWMNDAPVFDDYEPQGVSNEFDLADMGINHEEIQPGEAQSEFLKFAPVLRWLWGDHVGYFWRLSEELTYVSKAGKVEKRKATQWLPAGMVPDGIDGTLRGHLAHTYYGVASCMRRGEVWQRGSEKGAKWPNFANVRGFYADFDAADFDPEFAAYKAAVKNGEQPELVTPEAGKAAAWDQIQTLEIPPTAIVDTGGGYQCLWLLDEATSDFKRWKAVEAALVVATRADQGAKDLARVLRQPGTHNIKPVYGEALLVRVVEIDMGRIYTIDKIEAWVTPLFRAAEIAKEGAKKSGAARKSKASKAKKADAQTEKESVITGFVCADHPLGYSCFEEIKYPKEAKPIIKALGRIDVGRLLNYSGRVSLGMILYHESEGAAWALEVWKAAIKAATGHDYNAAQKWDGFDEHENPLTIGTLISWANSDDPKKPYSWPVFTAEVVLKLAPGQFVSDIMDFNALAWGMIHSCQSGTGSGKTYACYKQLTFLIHAVPLVGQVKQFSKKYGSAPVYAGHKIDPSARQHTTTYDGLHKFAKAHAKGLIDLDKFTFVKDECHHEAIDGFKDSDTFHVMNEVAALCGRQLQTSGTMPPLTISDFGTTYLITRDETIKPFSLTVTAMPNDTISRIFDYHRDKDKKKRKPLIWCHLNDKNLGAAYVADLAKIRPDLKAICLNKQTEEDEDPHHARITEGDGHIADDIDVVFVTSIFDDAVDIFCNRPVIHVIISLLAPISVEQSGARFRGNLPIHTYFFDTAEKRSAKKESDDKDEAVGTFHMLEMYERELERLEYHKGLIKKMLDYDANGQPLESVARDIIAQPLLKFYKIKGDTIEIDRVKLIQSLTRRWAGYCKHGMPALADALKPYGYEYQGEKSFTAGKDVKARKEIIQEEKKAKKREQNQRVRDAASQIEILAQAEDLEINAGNLTDRKTEEYQAAKVILKMYEAGMTFKAAKAYTETAESFHKKTLDNEAERVRAAMCYQFLNAGAVPTGPSSRMISMLFRWLEKKQAAEERVSPELWQDACLYATNTTDNNLARLRFFNLDKREHANARERGRFLKTLADVKRTGRGGEYQYEIRSVGRFPDSDLRASEIMARKLQDSSDKTLSNKEKERVLSEEKEKPPAKTATQAAFYEWEVSTNPDNVRKPDSDLPAIPHDPPSQANPIHPEPEPPSVVIQKLLDQEHYKQARAEAKKIKDAHERGVWLRRISAIKKEAERKRSR